MKNVNEEIEKTMQSLDGITTAEPQPFFYTRLEARLKARMENAQAAMPPQMRWVLKPAYLFSTLAIIILLNVVSAMNYSKSTNQNSDEQNIEGFAKGYGFDSN